MPDDWIWQGFEAPIAVADGAKATMDQDPRAGARVPRFGEPPYRYLKNGSRAVWAVLTRPGDPMPCPAGCGELQPDVVARVVGA
jgi:hypothetical protein